MVSRGRLGNSIRELRATAGGMTQAELGALVGVTRQTIIAIEQGKYSPSLESAFRIAHALNRPITEVVRYEFATALGDGN